MVVERIWGKSWLSDGGLCSSLRAPPNMEILVEAGGMFDGDRFSPAFKLHFILPNEFYKHFTSVTQCKHQVTCTIIKYLPLFRLIFANYWVRGTWMSMRINNLFEHDASMKRQVENGETTVAPPAPSMTATMFEGSVQEPQPSQSLPPNQASSSSNTNTTSNSSKPAAQRHRASIACASCRDRRIRVSTESQYRNTVHRELRSWPLQCVVPPGERDCTQCKRSKTECIIKNDDERRRWVNFHKMTDGLAN